MLNSFTVHTLDNRSKEEIDTYLNEITSNCPKNVKMYFIYFSGHGRRIPAVGDTLETGDGCLISTNHIREAFRKPNLHDKYKIFMFDICRSKGKLMCWIY